MKEIKLSGEVAAEHELVAIVDDDFPIPHTRRGPAKYHAQSTGTARTPKFYAVRRCGGGKSYLHVEVMEFYNEAMPKLIKGVREIDHINGNSMDNRVENLRIVTKFVQQQNIKNRKPPVFTSNPVRKSKTGYYGVYITTRKHLSKKTGIIKEYESITAKIIHCGNRLIKCFGSAVDAARQYDAWAYEIYGKNARLNFPEDYGLERGQQ